MSTDLGGSQPSIQNHLVVETKDLTKRYGKILALDRATFHISAGCTGLLGPNGAGKSTLLKLLLGLLTPDQGDATIEGLDVKTQPMELRRVVGYMPEVDCLPNDWLAQDFVRYMGELHGLPARIAIQRASDTLYHVGLGEERYRAIGGFSTGMNQTARLQSLGSFRETMVMESVKLAVEQLDAPDLKNLKYGPLTETPVKNCPSPCLLPSRGITTARRPRHDR